MTTYSDSFAENLAITENPFNGQVRMPLVLIESPVLNNPSVVTTLTIPVTVLGSATLNLTSPASLVIQRSDVLTESLVLAEVFSTFMPIQVVVIESAAFTDALLGLKESSDTLTDSAVVTSPASSYLTLSAVLVETPAMTDGASAQASLQALALEGLVMAVVLSSGDETYIGWVANSDTAAHAFWDEFSFNSLAVDEHGTAYGAMSDGIYVLDGDDDDGEVINYSLLTGKLDFGDTRVKSVPKVLVGGTVTGEVLLRVMQDDGTYYTYRARARQDGEQTLELKPGRGLRSRYYQFELYNEKEGLLDLSSIEFFPLIMTRQR